jgi:hypothetical protein
MKAPGKVQQRRVRSSTVARPKQRIYPDSTLSAVHDGEGWCIKAERHGEAPYYFGCYAIDARTAHWAAGEVASSIGCTVQPLRLN